MSKQSVTELDDFSFRQKGVAWNLVPNCSGQEKKYKSSCSLRLPRKQIMPHLILTFNTYTKSQ